MSPREDDELLTPGEVAVIFQVDPKTVTRWGAGGRLLSTRTVGGHRRFFRDEVTALIRGETREEARKAGLAQRDRMAGGAS